MKVSAARSAVASEPSAGPADAAGFGRALASAREATSARDAAGRSEARPNAAAESATQRGARETAAAPSAPTESTHGSASGSESWTLGSGLLGASALGAAADASGVETGAGLLAEPTSEALDAQERPEGELASASEDRLDAELREPEAEVSAVSGGDDDTQTADLTEAVEAAAVESQDDTSPSKSMKTTSTEADSARGNRGTREASTRTAQARAASARLNTDVGEADGTANHDGVELASNEPASADGLSADLALLRADAPAPLRAAPRTASAPVDPIPEAPLPEAEEVVDPALAMRLMREANGVQRAEVALEHPMFGALRMELALDDGDVDLRLLVPSLAGALRLERDEGEMRALLRDRGLRVASLEIDRPDPGAPQDHVREERPTAAARFVHHRYHWKA